MSLLYKPDWEEAKQHYIAWWNHEALDRCAMVVTAPRKNAPTDPEIQKPSDPAAIWTDLEYIASVNERKFRSTFYGGEAFPVWHGGYCGREFIPAFLGAPLHMREDTAWLEPILADENMDCSKLKIDPENQWWKFNLKFLAFAAEQSMGKAIPTIGAMGGSGDTLAALRGTEQLLYDLIDRPDRVLEAEKKLMDMWFEVYDASFTIIRNAAHGGATCWTELWAPGKFYMIQNDFSYMISPQQFQEIFLPDIERQTQFLDYALYHLDGTGAFVHVPALCELPRLQGIQVVPGTGKPSALHYLNMLQYIQKKGKNIQLFLDKDEVETALQNLSARGLLIITYCSDEDEARNLLRKATKWSRDR